MRKPEPFCAGFFCASCRTPFANEFPLDQEGRCALCRHGMRGFDAAYCFGSYDRELRLLIHLFKYSRMKAIGKPLANFLSRALPRDEVFDAIVPVPLHWRRLWTRGFNQAAVLGRELSRRHGLRFAPWLSRAKWTASQTNFTNAQRRTNVSAAFRVRRDVAGLRILLVDDVMTTGATAGACALALKRAGAESVTLLTLARVDRRLAEPSARKLHSGAS